MSAAQSSEDALRRSQALASQLISISSDAIVVIDEEQRIVLFNQGAQKIFGYRVEEVLNQPLSMLLPDASRARHREHVIEFGSGHVDARRMGERGQVSGRRKNGQIFPADASITKVDVAGDRFYMAVLRDIEAAMRTEDALRHANEELRELIRSSKRLTAILEVTPDLVGITDVKGNPLYLNQAARRTLGLEGKELGAIGVAEVHPPQAVARMMDEAIPTAWREGSWSGETEIRTADGRDIPVSQVLLAHRGPDGRVQHFSTIIRDITEQKRAGEAQAFLIEASRVLSSSLNSAQILEELTNLLVPRLADYCLLHIVDQRGHCRREAARHADPGRAALLHRIARFPPRESAGQANVLKTGESELVRETSREWLKASTASARHYRLLQRLAPESMIIAPLRVRSRVIGALTCVFAESHRRYDQNTLDLIEEVASRAALGLENARLHSAAQQAVRTRDEVLRLVAHDLRNPLNAIGLGVGLLLELLSEEMMTVARPQLEIIRRSAGRADRLIADLLDIARLEAGKLKLERKPVAPSALVQEASDLHRGLVEEKGVRLEARTEAQLPEIMADRERILQVFDNLLSNSLKFTPRGGTITIAAEREGPLVRFRVSDTGIGIAEDELPTLFRRFWQAGAGTRTGTGLGLAICRALVESHQGGIRAASRAGAGTSISFTVPAVRHD